jgi:hypothetical protein
MNLRLSERDLHVLAKCAVCKWLTTSQLQRVYFPHVTLDAVRKSLRRLHEAGYLASHREHRMAEALHGVGRSAKPLLEAKGLAVAARTPPRQIEHLVGINDMRLAVEVEAERLAYFFAAWELSGLGWTHTLIPDAVFLVSSREAARMLGLPEGTLRYWRCIGSGPAWVKLGRRTLYSVEDLVEFIARGRRNPSVRTMEVDDVSL